ncbi:hypothetical protein TYRP_016948 [Tyrophagus putrescentiae]|nr:hypothetical protein TYRP_016948 [Tyrophagus putrescentiae]
MVACESVVASPLSSSVLSTLTGRFTTLFCCFFFFGFNRLATFFDLEVPFVFSSPLPSGSPKLYERVEVAVLQRYAVGLVAGGLARHREGVQLLRRGHGVGEDGRISAEQLQC